MVFSISYRKLPVCLGKHVESVNVVTHKIFGEVLFFRCSAEIKHRLKRTPDQGPRFEVHSLLKHQYGTLQRL